MITGEDIYKLMESYAENSASIMRISLPDSVTMNPVRLKRYEFIDPVSVISICRLFQKYEFAFAFDLIPNFKLLGNETLKLIKKHHRELFEHVIFVFEVGEFNEFKERPYISLHKIEVKNIPIKDEYLYDNIIKNFVTNPVKKIDRKVLVKQPSGKNRSKTYFVSYSIQGE